MLSPPSGVDSAVAREVKLLVEGGVRGADAEAITATPAGTLIE